VRHRRSLTCGRDSHLSDGNCSNSERELMWTDIYDVVILITKSVHLQKFINISCVLLIDKCERVNSSFCL